MSEISTYGLPVIQAQSPTNTENRVSGLQTTPPCGYTLWLRRRRQGRLRFEFDSKKRIEPDDIFPHSGCHLEQALLRTSKTM